MEALQRRGYTNLVVADGPNIGTYRKGIDVLQRLGVHALCAHYGVECADLNHVPSREITLTTGSVRVARLSLEADLFVNLPKLKTHAEAGMSLALKSLIGCVSATDKRLVHADLPANIVALNEAIHPDLIIADALVAMEGAGPGDGTPRRADTLLTATDPFALDLVAARLFGLDPAAIPYLEVAARRGHLTAADFEAAAELEPLFHLEPPPPRGTLVRLLDSRALAPLRDLTRFLHGQEWARRLLYRLEIMQDVYEAQDAAIQRLCLDWDRCTDCGLCLDYCPLGLDPLESDVRFDHPLCRRCLYCFHVCPEGAIQVEGELGYLHRHLARYGRQIRSAVGSDPEADTGDS
jgi:ferredoxin